MHWLLSSTLPTVVIDVVLGFTAFFAGIVVALSYVRATASNDALKAGPSQEPTFDAAANDAARTNMAARQLRDLAQNVASDVGAHNSLVNGISDQLGALQADDQNSSAVVRDAATRMLEANKKLQSRLEDAEHKIQMQAEEIRTQQTEARTDALTKLANRRAFDASLDENLRRFREESRPFSLLVFDVDHFKHFNDSHGHQAGDEVLRCVGRTLARIVKAGDLPCRYGGEEFALVMANTRAPEAQVAAERVRRAIENMGVHFEGQTLRVTASIGLAEFIDGEDAVQTVRRADDGVYASKRAGRNCSHFHDGVECVPIAAVPRSAVPKSGALTRARGPLDLVNLAQAKLPDREAFADALRRRIAESHRTAEPLSVLHFRVKEFDLLELNYGRAVGSLLLDSLATFIVSSLRDMDLLARLDPGEFVVMIPGSSVSAAKIVGQRVRTSVSLCPIPMGSQQIRLELEMGVAGLKADDDPAAAMARARDALLHAAAAEAEAAEAEFRRSTGAAEKLLEGAVAVL